MCIRVCRCARMCMRVRFQEDTETAAGDAFTKTTHHTTADDDVLHNQFFRPTSSVLRNTHHMQVSQKQNKKKKIPIPWDLLPSLPRRLTQLAYAIQQNMEAELAHSSTSAGILPHVHATARLSLSQSTKVPELLALPAPQPSCRS